MSVNLLNNKITQRVMKNFKKNCIAYLAFCGFTLVTNFMAHLLCKTELIPGRFFQVVLPLITLVVMRIIEKLNAGKPQAKQA